MRRPASTGTSCAPGSTRSASSRPGAWAGWSRSGSPTGGRTSTSRASTSPASGTGSSNARHRAERTAEILGTVYAAHTPGVELVLRVGEFRSPVHDRMVAEGARLRDVSGWESAQWYAGRGVDPVRRPGLGSPAVVRPVGGRAPRGARGGGPDGHVVHGEVRRAGPDAGEVLDRLSAGAVNRADGVITYTQWLNPGGGIEADVTVTRSRADDFLVVASDTAHGRVLGLLRRGVGRCRAGSRMSPPTSGCSPSGPVVARHPRGAGTRRRLVDRGVPVPRGPARSSSPGSRCSPSGSPTSASSAGSSTSRPRGRGHVWDAVLTAGEPHGIRPAGLQALSSLRMEKGYRDFGHDIDNTDDVYGVGLGFAVALDKPGGFTGREATLAAKECGTPHHRLVQVLLAGPRAPAGPRRTGASRRRRRGLRAVGVLRLDARRRRGPGVRRRRRAGDAAVACRRGVGGRRGGNRHPARVSLRPMYDPTSARVPA